MGPAAPPSTRSLAYHPALTRKRGVKDQSLSSYDLSLCTIGAAKGWTDAELASLIAAHRTAHDDTSGKGHRKDYLIRTIASARAAAARMAAEEEARATKPIELVGEVGRGRITVPYRGEDLPEVVDAVQTVVLADRGAEPVFVYADRLVTVRRASPKTVHQLADRANDCPPMPMVFTYCAVALRERIARSVVIETWHARAKEWRAGICPREVAETLLKRAGAGAPPLTGVIETPTLRPDGSLLLTPGYDPATGLFGGFRPSDWRGLKTDPTQADAKAALAYLTDTVLAEFPFATGVDKAVAVAMICTGLVCRTLRGGVPLFGTSAPERATGKTALAELVAHSITGRPAAAASFSADEAEMRKLLTSVLREGHGVVCFDELPAGEPVDSGTLAKVATSSLHQDRMLGGNETGTFPTNALFILTGNNLTLAQNLASRTLTVYLDTDSEEPEKRAFKRDLTTWPDEHRVEVVSAALTVMRAYAVAGHPKPKRSESRFKGWDRTVRDALLWLGMPDPAIKFDEAKTEDPEREKRANLLAELTAAFPPGETHHFQASAVSARAGTNDPLAGALKQFQPCWRTIDPRAVGLVFRSLRNVWIGDMKLVDVIKATKKHPASWAILVKDKGTKA